MQIFRSLACLALMSVIAFSCQPSEKKKEKAEEDHASLTAVDSLQHVENTLYEEVMHIHDEVMPAMSDLMSLKRKLKKDLDGNSPDSIDAARLSAELEAANEGMMVWMRQFDPDFSDKTHEQIVAYLTEEREKIKDVRRIMEQAQKDAEEYLEER